MVKARKGAITEQDIKEAALNDLHFERATNNITLFERVKELEKVAADEDKALEDVIKENVHPSDRNKALELAGYITRNETPYIKEDGTICLKVEKWQDAAKVTEEELTEQLRTMDEELREAATRNGADEIIREGDSALSLMDKTVRETWENRKYIGKNEDLTLTNAKDIITYYKDKFKIDNNIKIKFVDGLGADGSTTGTTYLGKTQTAPKSKQPAIDKKKLQIKKLEDKITMVEGGNKEVSDPLENLKEELRIAKNELKALQKEARGANKTKLPDILIQMDKNAKNPYATLRSEIEHARDLAKGQVPDQKVQHFSRYKGLNEAEIAPFYIKKKADSLQARSSNVELEYGRKTKGTDKAKIKSDDLSGGQVEVTERSTAERGFDNGGTGIGLYVRRGSVWELDKTSKNPFNKETISNISYKELPQNIESGNSFYNAIKQAKKVLGERGAAVHIYTPEEYSQMKLFLAADGKSGVAVKPDGDIVSVFSSSRKRGHGLVELAKQNGGTKLDAFDTDLPAFYKKHGFTETGRDVWNEQYKPDDWNKEAFKQWNNGEPDVVYMGLKENVPIVSSKEVTGDVKSLTETLDDTLTGKVPLDEITLEDILLKAEKEIPVSGRTFEDVKNDSEHLAETLMKLKDEGQTALLEAFYKNPQGKFKIRLRAQVKILITALSRRRNCAD